MIGLIDCLKAAGTAVNLGNLKIHLACWNGHEHPIDVYYAGRFKEWQEWQTRRNFNCEHILGLIDLGQPNWLFAGVYKVLGSKQNADGGYKYSTQLLPGQEDMIGRIISITNARGNRIFGINPQLPCPLSRSGAKS